MTYRDGSWLRHLRMRGKHGKLFPTFLLIVIKHHALDKSVTLFVDETKEYFMSQPYFENYDWLYPVPPTDHEMFDLDLAEIFLDSPLTQDLKLERETGYKIYPPW